MKLIPTLRAAPDATLHHIVDRPDIESMATGVASGSWVDHPGMSATGPLSYVKRP